MEHTENLTTRSLLKGILATETVRQAVRHPADKSVGQALLLRDLRSNAAAELELSGQSSRVRRSLARQLAETSRSRRLFRSKKIPDKPPAYSIVDELETITPRTLMRKIIQTEDEVSLVISQRAKTEADKHTEEEDQASTRTNSLSDVNLSLPDLPATENVAIFKNPRKKRRVDISQFEKKLDESLTKGKGVSYASSEQSEDFASLEPTNFGQRTFEGAQDLSSEQSAYKKALLRQRKKAFLVSLGDFEQGVEDKYNLIKGSQECFIESAMDDKSHTFELNTELYAQPLPSKHNIPDAENILKSVNKSLVLKDHERDNRTALEASFDDSSKNVSSEAGVPSLKTSRILEEFADRSGTASRLHTHSLEGEGLQADATYTETEQMLSKSSVPEEDVRPLESDWRIQKPEVAEAEYAESTEYGQADELVEPASNVEKESPLSVSVESDGKNNTKRDYHRMSNENSKVSEKDDKSIKRQTLNREDGSISSAGHSSRDLFGAETSMDQEFSRKEPRPKVNKQHMFSAVSETPAYLKTVRFTAPKKVIAEKNIRKKTNLKTKEAGSSLKSSTVKRIFGLHAKMPVSKEAVTDIQKCLEVHLDQLSDDLAAYTAHANRKTITLTDMELLMKRQHFVTDATSLNVLIERHLPLQSRKLLIPCATGGNKVFPKM
ncbi:centromere protein T-like [Hyperolius riggenbachi]|uniref:centromere protein T-like n=1 Tax=Hyperolius riggenbachi TaxID=752182 RepID=UPI0035A26D77